MAKKEGGRKAASGKGWRIILRTLKPQELPGTSVIPWGTVTWSDGESFGVQFPKLKGEDRQRLQELVLKFATFRGSSQDHTAFRLA